MNEVEKMYENAGVKYYESVCSIKRIFDTKFVDDCNFGINCYSCPLNKSPFTAEKQLELIKWLAFRDYITIVAYISGEYHSEHDKYNANENSLEDCLARLINDLWQDLTEEERKQIKEILE